MNLGSHKLARGLSTRLYECSDCGIMVRLVPASSGLIVSYVWKYMEDEFYNYPDDNPPPMSCEERTMNEALE